MAKRDMSMPISATTTWALTLLRPGMVLSSLAACRNGSSPRPTGTNPEIVRNAAREFAAAELGNHRFVMVLHTHQANPHVHLAVRV